MINNNYVPEWYTSPFGHVDYTLVRNQTQLDILFDGNESEFKFMDGNPNACVNLRDEFAIVQIGDTSQWDVNIVHALLTHEAVHVWQHIRERMSEDAPSSEFEAYSIQRIAQDLFYMYQESESDPEQSSSQSS